MSQPKAPIGDIFSHCRRTLGEQTWGRVLAAMETIPTAHAFPEAILHLTVSGALPGYIADLARLELAMHEKASDRARLHPTDQAIVVNPTLSLIPVGWRHLPALIDPGVQNAPPVRAETHVMVWRHPRSDRVMVRDAEAIDLLALKLVVDTVDPKAAAHIGHVTVGEIQSAVDRGVDQGMLLSPASRIRRRPRGAVPASMAAFASSDVFTLQWHVTQACDLHCKHCYDRSDRTPMPLDMAMAILDDLHDFCRRMHVRGQVSFTGGNPLLYPHFDAVYRAAANFGFGLAILGNPTTPERLRAIAAIAPPLFYQISLEGLAAHNDRIRGPGHFDRSIRFLDDLRGQGIYAMVMLTLTRDNLDQVLPLAECLRHRADFFTFNRLSTVGEGASLQMPTPAAFRDFLDAYHAAAADNPIMGLKDNLFNVLRMEKGLPAFGGCTGYGCGAAFNFLSLLPDGEVHACRKFPSLLDNVSAARLFDIYHSDLAERYRSGAAACDRCRLNTVCRGCPAIAFSLGKDIFTQKDPYCFAAPHLTGGASDTTG